MVDNFVCTSSTPLALLTHLDVGTVNDENKENSCVSGKELFATRDRERSFFLETKYSRPCVSPITLISAFSTNKCSHPTKSLVDMQAVPIIGCMSARRKGIRVYGGLAIPGHPDGDG